MAEVQTVRGPVDATTLGRVVMHEHVFVFGAEMQQNYPDAWDDEESRVGDAVAKLRALRDRGIDTVVDPTVVGLGRYLPRIKRINEHVDINIIPATGIYTYNDVPLQFHFAGPGLLFGMPEPMVEMFTHDLEKGIADTGVQAAFLKCAIDTPGLTLGVECLKRAVAKTHDRTGAPITVHTHAHGGAPEVRRASTSPRSCWATSATAPT